MSTGSMLDLLFRSRPSGRSPKVEFVESDQPILLPPTPAADELPPEFEEVLQVQVLGYRERLAFVNEQRRRVLDPVWTLVPKDR